MRCVCAWPRALRLASVTLPLAACSLSPVIGHDISAYQVAAADAGNRQILVNIVRARDHEPLHFLQVTQVRGAASLSVGVSGTLPFGQFLGSSDSAGPTAMFSQSPNFDTGSLDDESFWSALTTEAVSPQVIAGLIRNTNVDPRVALLIFFSEWRQQDGGIYSNDLMRLHEQCGHVDPQLHDMSCFLHAMNRVLNGTPGDELHFNVHPFKQLSPVGPATSVTDATRLAALDPTKFEVDPQPEGRHRTAAARSYRIYSIVQQYAFCAESADGRRRAFLGFPSSAEPLPAFDVAASDEFCSRDRTRTFEQVEDAPDPDYPTLRIRSIYGIFSYLGDVLRLEAGAEPRCITLPRPGYVADPGRIPVSSTCAQDVLFEIDPPGETPVVSTVYEGRRYTLGAIAPDPSGAGHEDHSLEVLSLLNTLLNLNKNLQAVPTTPTVHSVM